MVGLLSRGLGIAHIPDKRPPIVVPLRLFSSRWNATSIVVGGVDLMDDGMTLRFTFSASGEYSYTVTNDFLDFCDPGPNCSDSGDFTATGSRITFDPGADEETFSYTISGSTLSISAVIDGFTFAFTFEKQ